MKNVNEASGGSQIISDSNKSIRADAQRNIDALLQSAKEIFAISGVEAPVREIADKAGVGVGTLYRHFPRRSDLIAAVFRREIDVCAEAASILASENEPFEALSMWLQRYAGFLATKRGLAPALSSGDPAYDHLREYFQQHLFPANRMLMNSALQAGAIREDVDADEILNAVASLCMSPYNDSPKLAQRLVALFVDGLRYRAA